jgi:tetratricopeptide (TPR) repeat protein
MTGFDLRTYLAELDHAAVVDLLMHQASADALFDARLRMDAARAVGRPSSTAALRAVIDETFFTDGYINYRDMYDYASDIRDVLATLRDLLDDGHSAAVITLAEHAIERAEDAVGYVDDSDGSLGEIAEDLAALHLDACLAARPDPIELATALFDRELAGGELDVFHAAAARYAAVLGEPGLAEYRRLASGPWAALPALGPGDDREFSSSRFALTRMMETLAELTGDVDSVVEVLGRDQSSAYQFLRISERYVQERRYDEALAWLEKGLDHFGDSDRRLVDATAEEYHRAGRGHAAVDLVWRSYEAHPSMDGYRRLAENCRRAAVWEEWHARAVAVIRTRVRTDKAAARRDALDRPAGLSRFAPVVDASDLVAVHLYDQDVELAWGEAREGGCSPKLWLELAGLREREYPLDAIPIWQREVERLIGNKNNQSYHEAVLIIARVRGLMIAAGEGVDFAPYAGQLRVTHKPKRNLMKLFDACNW